MLTRLSAESLIRPTITPFKIKFKISPQPIFYTFTYSHSKLSFSSMGKKKLKLIPFFLKSKTHSSNSSQSSWTWPSCSIQPKTLSFRAVVSSTPAPAAIFTIAETEHSADEEEEAVLSGLRAKDRLFFEPGKTSSILDPNPHSHPPVAVEVEVKENEPVEEPAAAAEGIDEDPIKGGLITEVDSLEPKMDFRRSMEEMVEAYGLTDWTKLEGLLAVFLAVNERSNHKYIIDAYAELLSGIRFARSPAAMTSSPISSSVEEEDRRHHHDMGSSMSTTMSSSPTSALSFSSTSCSSNVQSSLALIEPDVDDEIQIASTTSVI